MAFLDAASEQDSQVFRTWVTDIIVNTSKAMEVAFGYTRLFTLIPGNLAIIDVRNQTRWFIIFVIIAICIQTDKNFHTAEQNDRNRNCNLEMVDTSFFSIELTILINNYPYKTIVSSAAAVHPKLYFSQKRQLTIFSQRSDSFKII